MSILALLLCLIAFDGEAHATEPAFDAANFFLAHAVEPAQAQPVERRKPKPLPEPEPAPDADGNRPLVKPHRPDPAPEPDHHVTPAPTPPAPAPAPHPDHKTPDKPKPDHPNNGDKDRDHGLPGFDISDVLNEAAGAVEKRFEWLRTTCSVVLALLIANLIALAGVIYLQLKPKERG